MEGGGMVELSSSINVIENKIANHEEIKVGGELRKSIVLKSGLY